MTFFYDLNKRLATIADKPKTQRLTEGAVAEADYSAKAARAGKDIGKPGKNFEKIAKSAAERYGSKERGEKVAGAVLAKLRAKKSVEEADMEEGNKFTGNLAKARAAGLKKADLDGDGDMETVREGAKPDFLDPAVASKLDMQMVKLAMGMKSYLNMIRREDGPEAIHEYLGHLAQLAKNFTRNWNNTSDWIIDVTEAKAKTIYNIMMGQRGWEEFNWERQYPGIKKYLSVAFKKAYDQVFGNQQVAESGKPDFLDLDKDGNRKESMKQAARDAKKSKQASVEEGWDDMLKSVEKYHATKKAGEIERGAKHDIEHTATGRKVTRRVDPQGISVGADDDAVDTPKRGRGRPAGSGKKMGAKGPSGRSKLMKNEDHDAMPDRGEFDREGDMAKEQLHTIEAAAKELRGILSDEQNLPEWVQSKITKAMDYVDTARDYMLAQDAESKEEMPIAEKAVSKQQQKFMGMAHAMQKGEKIPGASKELKKVAKTMKPKDVEDFAKTKHKGLPKKKTEEVEETTVSGSVATGAAAPAKKSKGGFTFGKGIYDSMNREVEGMIAEGMNVSVHMGVDQNGQATKNISINADGEDADQLAQLLNLAGMKSASSCGCGTSPCSCEESLDENSPDWPTNTEVIGDDDPHMRRYAGGLNKPKSTGQTTAPVVNRDPARGSVGPVAEDTSANLYKEYKAYKTKQ